MQPDEGVGVRSRRAPTERHVRERRRPTAAMPPQSQNVTRGDHRRGDRPPLHRRSARCSPRSRLRSHLLQPRSPSPSMVRRSSQNAKGARADLHHALHPPQGGDARTASRVIPAGRSGSALFGSLRSVSALAAFGTRDSLMLRDTRRATGAPATDEDVLPRPEQMHFRRVQCGIRPRCTRRPSTWQKQGGRETRGGRRR